MKKILTMLSVILLMSAPVLEQDFCEGNFDYDDDQDGSDAFTFKEDFGRSSFGNPCPPDGPSPVPRTGQTTCYDEDGAVRTCNPCLIGGPCFPTGEDGMWQKGVALPEPRFTDNGDGTVTDNLTGLMWTKDADLPFFVMHWQEGLDYVATMNNLMAFDYNDWKLPNYRELFSLIDVANHNPALPTGHPFTNVQSGIYWSSTTYAGLTDNAWSVYVDDGIVSFGNKSVGYYIWPVRGGQ